MGKSKIENQVQEKNSCYEEGGAANMKIYLYRLITRLFSLFPIKKNKILFFSYYGSQYGCSPKYISKALQQNIKKRDFDIVWALNRNNINQQIIGVRKVRIMSLRYFYELATAKVIVTNFRTSKDFVKRKEQFYIQTWHSSLRLKKIEKDAEVFLTEEYIKAAKEDSLKCDLLLSGCKFSTDIFNRAFWYKGEILKAGTPRNDVFFKNNIEITERVKRSLGISKDTKLLLYAPTFRKDKEAEFYDLDYEQIIKGLKQKFGGEWHTIIRLHPHVAHLNKSEIKGVTNVSDYDDVQELLCASQVLISDYSSLIFDFALSKRPCFLYMPDYKEYLKKERELYFNIEELPFPASLNMEGLISGIGCFDLEEYKKKINKFNRITGSYERGRASGDLARRIEKICFG